jgi:hypothetical protein
MIHWLNPIALIGLSLLALPVLIHLLRAHRAERIPFPSLRFVHASRAAAVRLRLPSDWRLLCVRLAIVAAAVLAAAQPLVVTPARWRGWNASMVRAIVLDAGEATTVVDAVGRRPADLAREAAAAEARSAAHSVTIESSRLSDGLIQAAAWLNTAPPGGREIVVLSPFLVHGIDAADIARVPKTIGVRLVRVGVPPDSRRLPGIPLFSSPGSAVNVQVVALEGARTRVTLRREPGSQTGLRVIGSEMSAPELQPLWRALAAAGAPAPSRVEPLACLFGSAASMAPALSAIDPATPRWMLRTRLRMEADVSLRQIARGVTAAASLPPSTVSSVIAADDNGQPLVRLAASQNELVMQVAAPADSLIAAAAVRALLIARAGAPPMSGLEVLRIPDSTLAGWSRPAPDLAPDAWRLADRSDARWFWMAALVLLAAEQWLRRPASRTAVEVRDAA